MQTISDKGTDMHRIGYLLQDGFQIMAVATQAVFEYANMVAGEPFYQVENYSLAGKEVRSSLGLRVETRVPTARTQVDTWIVTGVGDPLSFPASDEEQAFLKKAATRARRVAAICTGGFVLGSRGCWKDGAPPRIGISRARCRSAFRIFRWKTIESISLTARSGRRQA